MPSLGPDFIKSQLHDLKKGDSLEITLKVKFDSLDSDGDAKFLAQGTCGNKLCDCSHEADYFWATPYSIVRIDNVVKSPPLNWPPQLGDIWTATTVSGPKHFTCVRASSIFGLGRLALKEVNSGYISLIPETGHPQILLSYPFLTLTYRAQK